MGRSAPQFQNFDLLYNGTIKLHLGQGVKRDEDNSQTTIDLKSKKNGGLTSLFNLNLGNYYWERQIPKSTNAQS